MKTTKGSTLEMYQEPNGNYSVILNGQRLFNCVHSTSQSGQPLGWKVMSLSSGHKNGRNRYADAQTAMQKYFGRKATVILPSEHGELA